MMDSLTKEEREALLELFLTIQQSQESSVGTQISAKRAIKAFTLKPKTKTVWVNTIRKPDGSYSSSQFYSKPSSKGWFYDDEIIIVSLSVQIEVPNDE